MGLGGLSVWQLLIILLIVVLLFGTKKLKGLGSDLGDAVKGFKKAVTDENEKKDEEGESDAEDKDKPDTADAARREKTDNNQS